MKYVIATNIDDAKTLRRILRKLYALPWRGKRIGKGHTSTNAVWTTEAVSARKHPTEQKWALLITDELRDMWRDHKDRLTSGERTGVLDAITAEKDLDPSWDDVVS